MNKFKIISSTLSVSILVLFVFQNCGQGRHISGEQGEGGVEFGSQEELAEADQSNFVFQKAATEVQPIYMNRIMVYNIFKSVFGESQKDVFIEHIAHAAPDFGSGWDLYNKRRMSATECNKSRHPFYVCNNSDQKQKVADISGANALREGRRMSACHLGVDDDQSLQHALQKIEAEATLERPPVPSSENLYRAFQLFFRGKPKPGGEVLDSFRIVHNRFIDKTEGWRQIVLGICLSPHWQAL